MPPSTSRKLLVATGAVHSYFGHDEWAEFAPGLKQIVDATRIRRSILMALGSTAPQSVQTHPCRERL